MFDPDDKTRRSQPIRYAQSAVRWFFRMNTLPFRMRVSGMKNYPRFGPMLVCSNHQSNLDPLILGSACPRPVNYLAKESLFNFGPLGWFLRWNDVIPIDRDGSGLSGIKETLKRLKKKESVLMFPEGTRSRDGELLPIKRGFCTLVKKAKVPIVPIGLDGALDALPRNSPLPNFGATIQVVIGEAIETETCQQLSNDELTQLLEDRIGECFAKARAMKNSASQSLLQP